MALIVGTGVSIGTGINILIESATLPPTVVNSGGKYRYKFTQSGSITF